MCRHRIKKIIIIGAIVCGLCVALFTSLAVYFSTNHAKKSVEGWLSGAIPGTIAFESMGLSLWRGQVELRNVVLKGPSGKDVAGLNRLFVDVAWTRLLRGDLTVEILLLEKPWARVVIDENGDVNLIQAVTEPKIGQRMDEESPGMGPSFNVVVRSLEVLDGDVAFDDTSKKLVAFARNIRLSADGDLGRKAGNLACHVDTVQAKQEGREKTLTGLSIQARLDGKRVSSLRIRMELDDSKLDALGSIDDVFDEPRFKLSADLNLSLPNLLNGLDLAPPMKGLVTGNLSFEGTVTDPRGSLRLQSKNLLIGACKVKSLDLHCILEKQLLTLKRFGVEGEDLNIEGSGNLDMSSDRMEGRLSLESPNLAPAMAALGVADISGGTSVRADISGPMKRPEVLVDLSGKDVHFKDHIVGDVHLVGNLDKTGTFHLSTWTLENRGSLVKGSGYVKIHNNGSLITKNPFPMDLSLDIEDVNLAHFVAEPVGRGTLNGHIRVFGNMDALRAKARFAGKDLTIRGILLGSLDGAGGLENGTVHLDNLTINNQASTIRVAGRMDLFREPGFAFFTDPVFDVQVEGKRILIQDFTDAATGSFSVTAQLKGPLSKPTGTLTLEGEKLDVGGQRLDGIALKATVDGERLWIRPAQLSVVSGEIISVNGWVSTDSSYDLSLVSQGVSLAHIDYLKKIGMNTGTFECDISGSGYWQDPQAHGRITLHGMRLREKSLNEVDLEVGVENHLAHFSTKAYCDFSGTYHLKQQKFFLCARFNETDLEPYFRLANQVDFGGTATGKVEVHGNLESLAELQASLDMPRLAIAWKGKNVVRTENLKALVKDQQVSLSPVNLAVGTDGHIRLHGTAKRNGPVAMEAQGDIPLAALAPFIEALPDLEGRLVLSARVDGSQDEPQMSAEVTMRQVGLTVPGLLQRLDDLEGRVLMDSREIAFDNLRGRLDGGPFLLTGKIGIQDFLPTTMHAQLKADAVPIRLPDTLDLLLNADLMMDGTLEQASVQGDIVLLEGTYYKDVHLGFLPGGTGRKREEPSPLQMAHPLFRNTSLDVSVKRRDALIVDNNLSHLEINPDLRVVGSLENPVIRGRATVESGMIHYRKNTFEVKKGYVDFSNPYKTEAYIDIAGETTVRHWTIVLALSGTPNALSFKLTSSPPEEDEDILSLLLVGRTTGELIDGEGGAGKSPAQMLAEAMAGALSDDIKEATGLDTLEVEVSSENGQDTFRVTVGKDLSRRLSVKHVTESKEGNIVERAIAEYKFLEHILFSGSQDTEGIFGGEVKYRLEFR